jgi:hypothetical protein
MTFSSNSGKAYKIGFGKIPTRELIWKTHDAESHADPIANFCSGQNCGFEKKLKLWMKRKGSGSALYNCFQCFTSEWVPYKVLPIGYEHVVSGSGERIEPRPVPTDALRVEASESTKAPNVVGRASSAKKTVSLGNMSNKTI